MCLFRVSCFLLVACWVSVLVRCVFLLCVDVCCLMFVVCCLLFVVCCLLFIDLVFVLLWFVV